LKGKKKDKKKRPLKENCKKAVAVHENIRDVTARVEKIAGPLCRAEGLELVHVEYQYESSGLILRIYIDKPGSVIMEDCVLISRQLNDLLDIHLEGSVAYSLEVSSPGSDRPLSKLEDYKRFKGEVARIKIIESLDGSKNFKGVLMGTSDENVNIMVENRAVSIPYEGIQRARLVDYNGDK
jgi:ribosome maturation factor RimP